MSQLDSDRFAMVAQSWKVIDHLHDDVLLLLRPEFT